MPQTPAEIKHKRFDFQALQSTTGLAELDADFMCWLTVCDAELADHLVAYRAGESRYEDSAVLPYFLLSLGECMDAFLIDLFGIEDAAAGLAATIHAQDPIFVFKTEFVQKRAKRLLKKVDSLRSWEACQAWLTGMIEFGDDAELAVAQAVVKWLAAPTEHEADIDWLAQWCAQAQHSPAGQLFVAGWVSFKLPRKLDYEHLVTLDPVPNDPLKRQKIPDSALRPRDGFGLTDHRMSLREALSEIDYCVYCHKNDGDFCSQGFPVKKREPELGLKVNPLDETLTGCPLDEKISEMHTLKKAGFSLGALAMIMRDNPMCPATGHRICNDCMKGCIYQKQDPVDIPQAETRILTDVLALPWGVEIYDLLTRWNPLRQDQFMMQPYNGKKVLVMGMGPAGFTMAHHLTMAGCLVVGADGLKIEPLANDLLSKPIKHYADMTESLDERVMAGFGGVAEYGITVRWDKNFLKLIYITLMRRQTFQVLGNVRFGGTVTIDEAWRLGFDHVTIAVGAGLPKELHIDNSLAPGMRQANDFLMALQLTGAGQAESLANLQVRLPAVVIGGGLTGVDTATEIQAYYIKQVEKVLFRYETLVSNLGEARVRSGLSPQDAETLDEFCAHGQLVREERRHALAEKRAPNFIPLLREWGGVTIVYRRRMQDSPAYRRNHEELAKALEEGIYYAEQVQPEAVLLDQYGACDALRCQRTTSEERVVFPAKGIFVATGAKPNVAYAFEHRHDIDRERFEYPRFKMLDNGELELELERVSAEGHVKMPEFGAFTSYEKAGRTVSFIGDTHPIFHGSVVKAIASAKRTYPKVMAALPEQSNVELPAVDFIDQIKNNFQAVVTHVEKLHEDAVCLTIKAPQLAHQYQSGQFYRLQNFATLSNLPLAEGVAALGFKPEHSQDELAFILFNRGVSSQILMRSQIGDALAVMGPTGVKLFPPKDKQHVLLIGDRYVIPYALSVAPTLRELGHRVTVCYVDEQFPLVMHSALEACCDTLIDTTLSELNQLPAAFSDGDTFGDVHVIGKANLLRSIQRARQSDLKPLITSDTTFKASVYGPMQCMLKGVCAQCLQWQIDPETGKRTKAVYACSWQHQPMDIIDMHSLDERLSQNSLQEHLTCLWAKTYI